MYPSYGGGFNGWDVTLIFRRNTVVDNIIQSGLGKGAWGGGINIFGQGTRHEVLISENIIASNKAIGSSYGGGIPVFNEAAKVQNNIIVKNSAVFGGGLAARMVYYTARAAGDDPASGKGAIARVKTESAKQSPSQASVLLDAPVLINNTIAYNRATSGYGDVNPQFRDSTYSLANTSGCLERGIDSVQIDDIWYKAPPFCIYGMRRPFPANKPPDVGACENPNPVGVDDYEVTLPMTFALEQNYPNPFNPTTTINCQLPTIRHVTLKVFDILGREVATVVNEVKQPGVYNVQWNASGVASGVYLYRLQAGSFVGTRKMVVVK